VRDVATIIVEEGKDDAVSCAHWRMQTASRLTSRVTRLDSKVVDEEVHEHHISFRAIRIGHCSIGVSMFQDECCVDVVKHVGPNLTGN